MPYSALMWVSLRDRAARVTMSFASLRRPLHFSPQNPRNPRTNPSAAMMKSGIYVPPIPRLRSVIACANGTIHTAATSVDYDWRDDELSYFNKQQSASYGRFAYDDFSEDDSDRNGEASSVASSKGASTLDNVDEWKWKLSLLLRNECEQEVISRERKDRRDYEQLAALAERMGLYRLLFLLDYKEKLMLYMWITCLESAQREKAFQITLFQGRVTLTVLQMMKNSEQQDTQSPTSIIMEKILRRRSFQLRNQQQSWQDSPEGQRMLEFRRSLPFYKEKEALLEAISRNQAVAWA